MQERKDGDGLEYVVYQLKESTTLRLKKTKNNKLTKYWKLKNQLEHRIQEIQNLSQNSQDTRGQESTRLEGFLRK